MSGNKTYVYCSCILRNCQRVCGQIDGDTEAEMTYRELDARVRLAAGGLQSLGVTPGDLVCVVAPNHVDYLVTFYASTLIGSTLQPLNPLYTTGAAFICIVAQRDHTIMIRNLCLLI